MASSVFMAFLLRSALGVQTVPLFVSEDGAKEEPPWVVVARDTHLPSGDRQFRVIPDSAQKLHLQAGLSVVTLPRPWDQRPGADVP